MTGVVPVIAVQGVVAAQNVWAVIILIVVLLAGTALMAGGTATKINLADRTIRKTWQTFVFFRHRVYSLDDYTDAEIQAGNQLVEGYQLSFFTVALVGKDRSIKVYSTDDYEDAETVQKEISAFFVVPQWQARP